MRHAFTCQVAEAQGSGLPLLTATFKKIDPLFLGLFVILALTATPLHAHPELSFARATVNLRANGSYEVELTFDLAAYLLEVNPGEVGLEQIRRLRALSPKALARKLAAARTRFLREMGVVVDGKVAAPAFVIFPQPSALLHGLTDRPSTIPPARAHRVMILGQFPEGAGSFRIVFPKGVGRVELTLQRPVNELLLAGEKSARFPLAAGTESSPTLLSRRLDAATKYLLLGFQHILPKGLDHILFVLALFLLSARLRPLLWQISAFTIAHSLTLGLSIYGIVSLPSSVVEPLIALSIALVAVENLFTNQLKSWRPLVVFVFGLVHGLGFAGALRELGLPRNEFLTALVTFNVGVELGQLSVVALALLAVGWFRRLTWYRARIVIPSSLAIALVGAYWTLERISPF
ncbi:MAG: HupE/UreJ family protein [Acidobacteriota bacterium]